jgi:plastocyanin
MTSPRYRALLTAVVVAMLWLVAAYTPAMAETPDPTTIVVQNFMFMPMALTVKAGSTVTWVNKDDEPHSVVSDTGLFRSGGLDTTETYSYRSSFSNGRFAYPIADGCLGGSSPHPGRRRGGANRPSFRAVSPLCRSSWCYALGWYPQRSGYFRRPTRYFV